MKTYTKEQLVNAMHKYNKDVLNNPNDFEEITTEISCAELQVNQLLSYIK